MFYVAVHLCAGVVQYDVGEDAGVVGCVVASVLQAGVDFGRTFATAGEGSASVDDDAAPVRRGSVVAVRLKGDGSRSCAFGENLSAAVHEDVLVETLLGEDGRTGVDGERAAYYDRTGERIDLVGGPVLRRAGLNGVSVDRFAAGRREESGPAECGGVAARVALGEGHVGLAVHGVAGQRETVGQADARRSDTLALAVRHVYGVARLACAERQSVDQGQLRAAAALHDVVPGALAALGRGVHGRLVAEGDVFHGEVRLSVLLGIVSVEVTVGLDAARVLLVRREVGSPVGVGVRQLAAVALGEVEAVVLAVHGEQVGDVDRSAEELDGVVSAVEDV